ncbi:MAG: FecR domain-containing protein, partial [bacterium]|nr:FecR domain-containing protein [bacterium]
MKRMSSFLMILTLCSGIVFASFYTVAAAAETCDQWVAKVVSVQGLVESRRTGDTGWQTVKLDDTYCPGDTIRVQAKSRADISLINRALLRLNQNSEITLGELEKEQTFFMNLFKGAAHFFSRITRGLEVRTPFTVAGVRGTEFFISVEEDRTFMSVFEGKVLASNEAGSLSLAAGQAGVARKGQAPVPKVVVRPRDAVRWALYYPPIVEYHPADFAGGDETDWRGRVRKSLGLYWQGDLAGAFSSLEGLPENIPDPR